jgi:hypothetical protein
MHNIISQPLVIYVSCVSLMEGGLIQSSEGDIWAKELRN